jgi:hypothetical protein
MNDAFGTIIHPTPGLEKKAAIEGRLGQLRFQSRRQNSAQRLSGIAGRIVVFLFAAAAPALLAQGTATPTMSVCQARRTIVTALQQVSVPYTIHLEVGLVTCIPVKDGCQKSALSYRGRSVQHHSLVRVVPGLRTKIPCFVR